MPAKKQTNQVMLTILAKPDTSGIRTQVMSDQEHTVIPVVMLTEGVLWPANAAAPELALAEEFGRWPETWDGRPIVLNHPQMNGHAVSANSPGVLENRAIGQIFNTKLDGTSLKAEMWINQSRVDAIGEEAEDALKRLTSGEEVVEVSTGLFVLLEEAPGIREGEKFSHIWRNCVPDHLAVLPEGIKGACSAEAGCGAPRTNATATDWGSYVLRGEGPVINSCGCEDKTACSCDTNVNKANKKSLFQQLGERFNATFKFGTNTTDGSVLSDNDLREALRAAIKTQASYFWIVAVFNSGNNAGTVVYEDWMDGDSLFSQDFKIDGGKVTLADSRTQVRPETRFVPVEVSEGSSPSTQTSQLSTNASEVITVDKEKIVQALIDNKATQFTADDKDALMAMEESMLQKLQPVEVTPPAAGTESDGTAAAVATTTDTTATPAANATNAAATATPAKPRTAAEFIADAPAEIQSVLQEGLRLQSERKDKLIKALMETKRCKFTDVQLKAKGLEELETLAELAAVPDYSGQGTSTVRTQSDANQTPEPPVAFPVKKAG